MSGTHKDDKYKGKHKGNKRRSPKVPKEKRSKNNKPNKRDNYESN